MVALVLGLLAGAAGPAAALELVPVARGARVTLVAEPGLEDEARRLARRADATLAGIEEDVPGLPRLGHVEVRLVKHAEDLPAAAPPGRGAPPWAVGVAYTDVGVVTVAARTPTGALNDMGGTFRHELAHMVLERALGEDRAPRWLHEGFAYLHSSDFSLARAQTLAGAVFRGDVVPLAALEHAFPLRHDGASLAYAQSYDFVAFLAHRGRFEDAQDDGDRWAFRFFLQRLGAGDSLDQAAHAAFGRGLPQLEGEWLESLRSRYFWYPVAALGGAFWVAIALLAVVAWRRKRRQMRKMLAQMEAEEAAWAVAGFTSAMAPEGSAPSASSSAPAAAPPRS
jgi:hypothetical protein